MGNDIITIFFSKLPSKILFIITLFVILFCVLSNLFLGYLLKVSIYDYYLGLNQSTKASECTSKKSGPATETTAQIAFYDKNRQYSLFLA